MNSQIAQSANQLFRSSYRNMSANCGNWRVQAVMARLAAFHAR
ncbi:hypothetical protein O59_004153 [Cellvibrio sp. BR]|nr:hypothetical protein O59_004153 [Cellvibrio sp. BR]